MLTSDFKISMTLASRAKLGHKVITELANPPLYTKAKIYEVAETAQLVIASNLFASWQALFMQLYEFSESRNNY